MQKPGHKHIMKKTLLEGFVLGQIGVIVFKFSDETGCAFLILKTQSNQQKEVKSFFMCYVCICHPFTVSGSVVLLGYRKVFSFDRAHWGPYREKYWHWNPRAQLYTTIFHMLCLIDWKQAGHSMLAIVQFLVLKHKSQFHASIIK